MKPRPFYVALILTIPILFGLLVLFSSPKACRAAFHYAVLLKNEYTVKNKVIKGQDGWLFFEPDLDYILDTLPGANVQSICEFNQLLRKRGISLYVLPIPSKIEIYPEKFVPLPALYPVKAERDTLIGELRSAGVRVIDVVPEFIDKKDTCRIFDANDSHWTPEGIELAAQIIAEQIDSSLQSLRIPKRKTRYVLRDTTFLARGDILGRYTGKERLAWYPIEVRQVLDQGGHYYRDDKKSRIMILGDSFVDRGSWWNAHLGAHLARIIGYPTKTYFSLRANTNGPCMYAAKPGAFPKNGIVIWAFTSRVLRNHLCNPEG